ncbi:MAG: hypothetical protein N838_26930 [Thiohalocapsa sp. PB-PSB1]|jgi:hypothetical protein|nr:MAG: hypothetical protein N838_26930 [Thiohalocapsa sp. PB-PSB1]
MAIRLENGFGGSTDIWLRMQAAYDLAQARKKDDLIHVSGSPNRAKQLSIDCFPALIVQDNSRKTSYLYDAAADGITI